VISPTEAHHIARTFCYRYVVF